GQIDSQQSLPPPPQQSIVNLILVKRIGELKQHMADLLQNNLALEERLNKHGSQLYKLENLNIPDQVSKAVDEIVTDAVDWAISHWSVTYQELLLDLQPPPPTRLAGASGAPGTLEASGSSKFPLPPPSSLSTGTFGSAQQQGSKALTGVSGTQELSPTDSLIQDHSILDEQVHLSDDEDSKNDHLPKADSRKDWWKPLPEEERPATLKPA
nr:hypothetical protein [Tanacetum cinerariifolium]